ncbi:hypothetical protein EVAR_53304_1 [Eumeta japonica]|uniref:Uncharacterized protein n=1 Tax=Eumeta variegata TaxID=151549 RepID=A0A4C1X5W4_EUMVA|nr:hypothetical protein EVAR_53304_1 [Eumeta japonica]
MCIFYVAIRRGERTREPPESERSSSPTDVGIPKGSRWVAGLLIRNRMSDGGEKGSTELPVTECDMSKIEMNVAKACGGSSGATIESFKSFKQLLPSYMTLRRKLKCMNYRFLSSVQLARVNFYLSHRSIPMLPQECGRDPDLGPVPALDFNPSTAVRPALAFDPVFALNPHAGVYLCPPP